MPFSFKGLFQPSNSSSSSTSSSAHSHPASPPSSHPPLSSPPLYSSTHVPLLVAFLQSPLWRVPLDNFIDSHSLSFTPNTEHSFSHTTIHQAYVTLAESLLASHLTTLSIPPSSLPSLLSTALASSLDPSARRTIESLLVLDDYLVFHALMVARNTELDGEVLDAVLREEAGRKNKTKERERQRGAADEEEEALRVAISLSLMEEEREKKEREREKAELDLAIALSLALQAQDVEPSQPPPTSSPAPSSPPAKAVEEEEKQLPPAVAAVEPAVRPSSEAASTASSRRSSGSVTLAPLKLRKSVTLSGAPAAEVRAAAVPVVSTPPVGHSAQALSSGFTAAELQAKAEFLRAQRDLLVLRKQQKADEELRAFQRQVREEEAVGGEGSGHSGPSAEEVRRAAMQRVLRERLKEEAEKTIGRRQEQRAVP